MDRCKTNMFFFRSSTYGFLIMLLHLQLQVARSTDTILANQSLSGFQTIVSSGGVFELGFFSKGTPSLFYLGIWYNQVFPKTIVWVANPELPAPYITSISLNITNVYGYYGLSLYDNSTENMIWGSVGIHDSPSDTNVEAVLLDSGNLVLRDGNNSVLWQSFENPSDTWLPGAKIRLDKTNPETRRSNNILTSWNTSQDPSAGLYSLEFDPSSKGNSLIMVWNGSKPYWSSGAWDDRLRIFKQVRFNRNLSFEFNLSESYVTYSVRNQNPFRLVMDVSGQLMAYSWLEKQKIWESPWSAPDQKCMVNAYCGSFGICHEDSSCRCAPGFRGLNGLDTYFDPNDTYGGCISEINLEKKPCGKKDDKFLPLENMKYLASDPEERVLTGTTFTTCGSACLDYCFCKAYAYDGNRCLIWTSDHVFNLQQLDANNSHGRTFYVRLLTAPENISNKGDPASLKNISGRRNHHKLRSIVLAVFLPSLALTALFIILYCCFSSPPGSKRAQKDKKQSKEKLEGGITDAEDDDGEQRLYLNLHDIMTATNSFSEENKLGQGGFGPVYKGYLPNGIEVAMKRLSKKSSQGLTEFRKKQGNMSSTKIQVQGQPFPWVSSRNHRMRISVVCAVSMKRHHRVSSVFSQRVNSGPSLGSVPKRTDEIPYLRGDGNGRFGRFGGKFVPETLISPLRDLEDEFNIVLNDHEFQEELTKGLRDYGGRETPLYFAGGLTEHYKNLARTTGGEGGRSGGPEIFLKREDLSHCGSHKINNALAQAMIARRLGCSRVVAATGSGQHGVATAAACAKLSLQCTVFMGTTDMEKQFYNVQSMELLGAQVKSVEGTFQDASSEAIRNWVENLGITYYLSGTVVGPHPCPVMVREFQSVIGKETRRQANQLWGGKPDVLVACVGSGSNALGLFHEFVGDEDVRLVGVEAAGLGLDSGKHSATLAVGDIGVYHGTMSYLLQDDQGQILRPHSIGVGLEYPGVGPEISFLKETGRAEFYTATDQEAIQACMLLSRLEGIIPALEASHALAFLDKLVPTLRDGTKVVVNCSGRGDKDLDTLIQRGIPSSLC